MSERTALYRQYDASGVLLYVGISLAPFTRLEQHKKHSHWFPNVTKVAIEHFETRAAAERAERMAIAGERPKHNVVHAIATVEERSRRAATACNAKPSMPPWVLEVFCKHGTEARYGIEHGGDFNDVFFYVEDVWEREFRKKYVKPNKDEVLAALRALVARGELIAVNGRVYLSRATNDNGRANAAA